jgi:hypothetical protein
VFHVIRTCELLIAVATTFVTTGDWTLTRAVVEMLVAGDAPV